MNFSDFKKNQIVQYKNNGKWVRNIGCILRDNLDTISIFIRKLNINGKRKKTGRLKKLTPRDEGKLASELGKGSRSISKIENQ